MATICDEVLIDPYYAALAKGGPEFSTFAALSFAGVGSRAINRYHYISKYEINYAEVEEVRRAGLREFHIMSWGGAYAFRFLAPDDSKLDGELVTDGVYNPATITAGSDPLPLYLIKTYRRLLRSYQRRIVKPAWSTIVVAVGDLAFEVEVNSNALDGTPLYGGALYGSGPQAGITLDYTTGIFTLDAAARAAFAGQAMKIVKGQYHLPVVFGNDWNQMASDPTTISEWPSVTIQEVLPAELGILQ